MVSRTRNPRWGPEENGPQTPGRMRSAKGKRKWPAHAYTEPRSRQLNLRFTASELETISKRADALGMRPVHFGRTVLLGQSGASQGKAEPASNTPRLIHAQLARLGNNLNQMVRHLHHTGDPVPSDLEPLLNDIRRLIAGVPE